jgi:hypothetical protein
MHRLPAIGFNFLAASWLGCLSCLGVELVTITTPKTNYFRGEHLEYTIGFTPPGFAQFPGIPYHTYQVDSTYLPAGYTFPVVTTVTQPKSWAMQLDWQRFPLTPGFHSIYGIVPMYGTSAPVVINVIAPPIPANDFLIDCRHLIGTTNLLGDLLAYESQGVTFRTRQGNLCSLSEPSGISGQDPAPDKCNVVAHFAKPVFKVTAHVRFGGNSNLTAIAKNSSGQILTTVVSATNVSFGSQIITVESLEPIASVEWRPNGQETLLIAVHVQELAVATGPILHQRRVGTQLELYWPTINLGHYQLWSSTNLLSWTAIGAAQIGTAQPLTNAFPIDPASGATFYRVTKTD